MARPRLSEESFLRFVFGSDAKPTGLRHKTVKGPTGRKASRVTAYNRMSAEKQAIIDQTGSRDQYLRGEITQAQARRKLRERAEDLGITKPTLRYAQVDDAGQVTFKASRLDAAVINHMRREGITFGKSPTKYHRTAAKAVDNMLHRLRQIPAHVKTEVIRSDRATIRRRAHDPSFNIEVEDEPDTVNPYWYH